MNEQEKLPDALPYYSIVGQADYNDPWRRGYACCIEWQKKQDDKYYQYALARIKELEAAKEAAELKIAWYKGLTEVEYILSCREKIGQLELKVAEQKAEMIADVRRMRDKVHAIITGKHETLLPIARALPLLGIYDELLKEWGEG